MSSPSDGAGSLPKAIAGGGLNLRLETNAAALRPGDYGSSRSAASSSTAARGEGGGSLRKSASAASLSPAAAGIGHSPYRSPQRAGTAMLGSGAVGNSRSPRSPSASPRMASPRMLGSASPRHPGGMSPARAAARDELLAVLEGVHRSAPDDLSSKVSVGSCAVVERARCCAIWEGGEGSVEALHKTRGLFCSG